MSFLKNILSSAVGVLLAFIWLILLVVLVGVVVGSDDTYEVKNNSVLKLQLSVPIKDYAPVEVDPFSQLLGLPPQQLGLNEIISAIDRAKDDDRIKAISIEGSLNGGVSQLNALRNAVIEFKQSGKPVYAYADTYGQKEYSLHSGHKCKIANFFSSSVLGQDAYSLFAYACFQLSFILSLPSISPYKRMIRKFST